MAIPQSQTTLKSYFETGDVPTQAEFAELIDTMFALYQDAIDSADAAQAAADAAEAAALAGAAKAIVSATYNAGWTIIGNDLNVDSITIVGGSVRVTFTEAFADANYVVVASVYGTVAFSSGALAITSVTQATGNVALTLNGTAGLGARLSLAIYKP